MVKEKAAALALSLSHIWLRWSNPNVISHENQSIGQKSTLCGITVTWDACLLIVLTAVERRTYTCLFTCIQSSRVPHPVAPGSV